MAFDGLVTGAVARQLSDLLTGGKIEKIYHPESEILILHIQNSREKYRLLLSAASSHARIHLIDDTGANPQNPTPFCMLLRKHLQGGRIAGIRQVESERIVEILVDSVNELGVSVNRKLTIEIMGKHSNIIAVDLTTGRILDSIKRISMDVNRYRQILPGMDYVAPPSQGKHSLYTLTQEDLEGVFVPESGSRCLVDGIQGISPAAAEGILATCSDPSSCGSVFASLTNLRERILSQRISPVVYLDPQGSPKDFHIMPLPALEESYRAELFPDPSRAADYFYSHKTASNRVRQKSSDLFRAAEAGLHKQYLKKQRLCEDLKRAEESEIYRMYGELLTAGLHNVPAGAKSARVPNYYDNTFMDIPLDPKYSPAKNAQRYFKLYGKSKTALREKSIQLEETNSNIEYLESVLVFVENAGSVEEIEEIRQELVDGGYLRKRKNNYKPSKSKLQPYAYTTGDGFRILAGRNNRENDILTLKTADKKDLWFHTKDIPGSHVILFTNGRKPSEEAIRTAAAIAAWHSKGRNSENVPVDYTSVRHVHKPNGAKPGMVIFTDNHTLYITPENPVEGQSSRRG